jgi:hypothetical protein
LITSRWNLLSDELKVAVKIQELNKAKKHPYFSLLIDLFKGEMSHSTVHAVLRRLIDKGTISADWIKVENKWVRKYYIAGEITDFIDMLIAEIYE